jgi:hypothetical protein
MADNDHVLDIPNDVPETNDEQEEKLQEIYDAVQGNQIEVAALKEQIKSVWYSSLQTLLSRAITVSEALQARSNLDAQEIVNQNEVLNGEVVERLGQMEQRLRNEMHYEAPGPLGIGPRNWTRIKFLAAGGLALFGFVSSVFDIISFVQSLVNQNNTLLAVLAVTRDSTPSTAQEAVQKWIKQDEEAFWKR